jgi:hypothetical protein
MNTTLRKALQTEYVLLRTPLAALDERVLTRLDETSRLRTTVERGLSVLDSVAARVLGPEGARGPAGRTGPEGGGASATAGPPAAPAEEVDQLAATLLAEQEEEHNLAGELAEDEELRRVQAELKAKHRIEADES